MSKNENKELNAILEQLKNAYSDDESVDDAELAESEDDFQKMLSNYFSDSDSDKDIYKFTASESANTAEKAESEYAFADLSDFEAVEASSEEVLEDAPSDEDVNCDETVDEEIIAEDFAIEEIIDEELVDDEIIDAPYAEEILEEETLEETSSEEVVCDESVEEFAEEVFEETTDNDPSNEIIDDVVINEEIGEVELSDKDIVDDVFAVMFPQSATIESEKIEPSATDEHVQSLDIAFDLNDEEYEELDTSFVVDLPSPSDDYAFVAEDVTETIPDDFDDLDSEIPESTEIDMFTDVSYEDEADAQPKETIDDVLGSIDYDDEDIVLDISAILPIEDTVESEDPSDHIAADADESVYFSDPLQGHLSDAAFVSYKIAADDVNFDVDAEAPELDDEEISLLLDFGYDDEAEAEAGRERTNEIKRKGNFAINASQEEKIFGYCGEEYSHKSQNSQIKEKYAKDKKDLLIKAAIAFSLTVILFFMGIISCFASNINYLIYLFVEIAILCGVSFLAYAGLKGGIVNFFKLEPNFYSTPAIVMVISLIYDLFSLLYVAISSNTVFDGVILPVGFFASTYVFACIFSELLEAYAEANAFDVISDNADLYTAEKLNKKYEDAGAYAKLIKTQNVSDALDNHTFEVRKTSIPVGYFGRMSKKQNSVFGSFYIVGAILAVSLIIGCVALIMEGNLSIAAYSSMSVVLMGMPISFALVKSLPKLASSIKLKEKGCAIVGDASSIEYSCIDTLIFDDESAIEIVDKIEIRPEADNDIASAMKITARAFKALGGPISKVVSSKILTDDEKNAEISVISLRDNGIELYMDSSIYMLIGDAAFMSTFGIRVSADRDVYISSEGSKHSNIIYIAIDGVPRLGYIINSKISDAFASLVLELDKHGIKSGISSYDPTVNDYYFEQNKIQGASTIVAYKPEHFYNKQEDYNADGGIFSNGDAKNIIYPLIEIGLLNRSKKINKLINYLASALGCIASVVFVLLAVINSALVNLSFVTFIVILLVQAASATLVALNSFEYKRKRD